MIRARAIFMVLGILLPQSHTAAAAPWFTNVTESTGLWYIENQSTAEKMRHRMTGGAAAADFDRDGWVDLYVTRRDDFDLLFRNMGDGTFQDVTASAFGDNLRKTQSNGAAWGDIDNDGDPDLYVTAFEEGRYFLFNNNADGTFTEVAQSRGAAIESDEPHYGFGVAFGDYDLDGFLDIYTSEWRTVWETNDDGPTHARLLHSRGPTQPGYFDDVTQAAGVSVDKLHPHGDFAFSPRFTDLDGDGWPGLASPDRFLVREIDAGSNFLGQNELTAHFGLGPPSVLATDDGQEVDRFVDSVTIRWPSGHFQQFTNVPRNSTLIATEPIPEPSALSLAVLAAIVIRIRFRPQYGRKVLDFSSLVGSVNKVFTLRHFIHWTRFKGRAR
jgi:hypothetical protein